MNDETKQKRTNEGVRSMWADPERREQIAAKISKTMTGRTRSIEECEAISRGKTGRKRKPFTAEHRAKIGESIRRTAEEKRAKKNILDSQA